MARSVWMGWILPVAAIAAIAAGAFLLLGRGGDGGEEASESAREAETTAPGAAEPAPVIDAGPTLEGVAEGRAGAERDDRPGGAPRGGGTLFTGQVVDLAGNPAPGATVEARTGAGVVAAAKTDAEGRFAFRLVVSAAMQRRPGTLRARGTDGSVGSLPLYFVTRRGGPRAPAEVPAEKALGTVRLGPPHGLDVRVTSSCPDGLPATVWLVPATITTSAPWTVTETDGGGAVRLEGIPAGRWMLVAASPGCGRVRALARLPRESIEPVELELPDAHPLTIRVQDAEDQSPIAGAALRVAEQLRFPDYSAQGPLVSAPSDYVTDAEGVVRIEGLGGTETLYLHAEAEGYPQGSEHARGRGRGPGQARTKPGDTEVVIELHRPLTVRWPIEDKGIGRPADGTAVVLEPWTNTGRLTVPPGGVIQGGELVVEGWGPDGASGYAVIPGQGIARLSAQPGETVGYPTAFYPLRRVELVVRLSDGSPASGWFLVVRDGGNNAVRPEVETDAEGRAAMEGLFGGPGHLVNVSVSSARGWGGFTLPLGSVNLYEADGRFEARIPVERTLHVRLTIQGREVPADFRGAVLLNHRPAPTGEGDETSTEPGLHVIRWRPARPEGQVVVSARAHGYLAESRQVPLADASDPLEVSIDLRPAGAVRIRVREPEDKRYKVGLQPWDAETETWRASHGGALGGGRRADANGVLAFELLEPGRYRAVDTSSGLTTEGFDVVASGEPAEVELDLRTAGWVKGHVEVPDGVSFDGVSVGLVDATQHEPVITLPGAPAPKGRPVGREDGVFWVRVPGTHPVTLRVFHPTLEPHATKGSITLTRPRDGVLLRAVRGAVATIRFATPANVFVNRGRPRSVSVRLYEGPVEGAGLALTGTLDGEHRGVEFGGYEPGTWTVWIDVPNNAPVVRNGVTLGAGDTDLGEVHLDPGAMLTIRVRVQEGQSPPRYSVWLQKLDEPKYTRQTDASGETIVVRGLGAGRFSVHAMAYNGASPGLDEEIEFDGTTEVVRTIDAR